MRSSSDLTLWVLSAAIGALGIVVLFTLGVPGVVLLFVLVIMWIRSGTRRSLRAGGAFAGFGATFLALMAPPTRGARNSPHRTGRIARHPT